jgi:hypothetical protein
MIGRFEKIRAIGPSGYGPPLMLDRGSKSTNAQVRPYKGEYWDRARTGLYVPRIAGGIGFSGTTQVVGRITIPNSLANTAGLAQTTTALDSNYVAGTSGDAIGARIVLPATKTFDTLYFFITGYTGTAANVNDLDLEIRAEATGGIPDTTGTIDTETLDPASATGWVSKQFATPQNLTGGTRYHLIVGDADGNGTDFATVLQAVSIMFTGNISGADTWHRTLTTGGWASGNTVNNKQASSVCAKFSDGTAIGCPFSTATSPSNNQLRRGLLMSGLTETIKILGYLSSSSTGAYTGVEIFAGTDLSNATPFATADQPIMAVASSTNETGFYFSTPVTLAKSTQYRHVFTYNADTTVPVMYEIGTGADATLKSMMFGGGSWYWTIDSAGPVWVDDDDAWPNMALIVEDQIAVASGGRPEFRGANL